MQTVVTTTDPNTTLQQPTVVTSNKVKANPQVLKVTLGGKGKGPPEKGKGTKPLNKGRKNVVKQSISKIVTSTGPSGNPMDKTKDRPKVTVAMIQDLVKELQTIEQESLNDGHDFEVTQESDQEQEDSEIIMTEDEEQ